MAPLHQGWKHPGSPLGCRRRYLKRYFSLVKWGSAEMSKTVSCQHIEDTLWWEHHHTGIRLLPWKSNHLSCSREVFPWHISTLKSPSFLDLKFARHCERHFRRAWSPEKNPNQTQLKMAFSLSNHRTLAETSVGQECSLQLQDFNIYLF